ncbi:hypothetical protein CI109_102815 [Kwoniella shandongensis]|uniref:MARVEL domain-containing protein n=1 Tax=Kwoniella shandongensis TaxID=1734106 RepID=A0A5M6C7P2_9TREE|nr:uncharacterized protein CI109_000006 [Kwoniella shandongensis]KAA5531168.1 hypothetical protein CI109_000006 [Kwoniella shandongensis]
MVDAGPHIKRGHPIFFGLLTLFALIEGAVTSWLVSRYNDHDTYPSNSYRDRIKFLVFVSWWTFVFSAGYIVAFFLAYDSFISSIASHLGWVALTWIFWLAGASSFTAANGGGHACNNSSITYCNQLEATEAFAWIEWILITLMFISMLWIAGQALRRGDRLSGSLA